MKKTVNILFITIILSVFVALGIGALFSSAKIDVNEKRELSMFPSLSIIKTSSLIAYRDLVENYLKDRLLFRENIIRWNNIFKYKVFNTSANRKVQLTDRGWLFSSKSIKNYKTFKPFSKEQLNKYLKVLERRQQYLKDKHIRYIVYVAPNKPSVYPDELPKGIDKRTSPTFLEQFSSYVKIHSDIMFIDFLSIFRDKKESLPFRLYAKTDTHWNNVGDFIVYQELMKNIKRLFPNKEISIPNFSDFTGKKMFTSGGNLTRNLSLLNIIKEEDYLMHPLAGYHATTVSLTNQVYKRYRDMIGRHNKNGVDINFLMFGDSYTFREINRYLSEEFVDSTFVRVWYWDRHSFQTDVINVVKPDVVVQEITEFNMIKLFLEGNPTTNDYY